MSLRAAATAFILLSRAASMTAACDRASTAFSCTSVVSAISLMVFSPRPAPSAIRHLRALPQMARELVRLVVSNGLQLNARWIKPTSTKSKLKTMWTATQSVFSSPNRAQMVQ